MDKRHFTQRLCALTAALLVLGSAAQAEDKPAAAGTIPPAAQGASTPKAPAAKAPAEEAACAGPELKCAVSATPAFAPDGALWLAWAAANQIWVARSPDKGKTFAPAVAITPAPAPLDCGPESRPKIVIDAKGAITVAYTVAKEARHHSQAMVSRSTDGGKTFPAPKPLTPDTVSQRFETLATDPDGRIFAAWIDKRKAAAAKAAGEKYAGSTLAYAWTTADGATFGETRFAADHICECCRMDSLMAAPGKPVVLFRNIFDGGIRDHAIVAFDGPESPGALRRVAVDDWAIDACPHQGPAMARTPDGALHIVWFTQGKARKGVFYARSTDGGQTFSEPKPLGAPDRQISRPAIISTTGALFLGWKEFDGEKTVVQTMASKDGGASWGLATPVAETADASDHPLLISDGHGTFLSWLSRAEGYRLLPVEE